MTDGHCEITSQELQESEIPWQNIIASAMDGIISINEQQRIISFNAAAEIIFGYRSDQVIGQPITMLIPDRFRANHSEHVEEFGKGTCQHRRMDTHRMVKALRSNGEEFPVESSISHNTVRNQKIYTAILRDVTESVRQRALIHEQSQMLQQVSDAIQAVDLQGRITYWNCAAERLFGWSAAEVLGKDVFNLLYRASSAGIEQIRRELKTGRPWSGEQLKIQRDGKTILVEHRQTPLCDEAGVLRGYLCINIDITDRRKREQAQRRSQRLESIGTLAGGIAHDLNNVLTPILLGAKLLSSGNAANRDGLLQTMVASANRGAALVRQLLTFAGGVRGDRSPQRIDELVNETRSMIEHTLPKSIRIQSRIAPGLPAVIGDATELSQVLMNLCINARDAMPNGGVLTIDADPIRLNGNSAGVHPDAHQGEYVLLKVSDTGIGMSSEVLERIFDPFYTTKEVGRGTGLGLATVQGIVKNHGGFITVYSELGRGSKFSIYLPATSSSSNTSNTANVDTHSQGLNHTILLVDDETAILRITSAALESAGYRVLTAANGLDAIELYQQHRQDISAVLLDMMMPGMDGLQVLDELRRLDSDVVVIACSGLQTSDRESAALKRGAKAFLAKPYSDDQVLSLLRSEINSMGA